MKKLLGIVVLDYRIMWDKLDTELDRFEIKQETLRQFGIELDPDTGVTPSKH